MSVSAHPPVRDRIVRVLRSASAPRSITQLSVGLGVSRTAAKVAIGKLCEDGLVEAAGKSDWLGDLKPAEGFRLAKGRVR